MSTRCRHDLQGSITQLRSQLHRWREAKATVAESWSDETADRFHEEYLSTCDETLSRLIAGLQEATELIRSFEKKVSDDRDQES
ncbi:MAG: WXG100 family type VII secretion target [Planctomycetota bacterium]|nr:WXG100 family type VII secretion target [Planctomycetota bacterium]